jgi:hypothetical protein
MKSLYRIFIPILLVVVFACSASHPTSYDELRHGYSKAHELKHISRINDLIYWGSMPSDVKKRILDGIKKTFSKTIKKVELVNLSDDFEMKSGSYVYPFVPGKTLKVEFENPGKKGGVLVGTEYILGMKEGKVYILYRSEDAR